MMHDGLIDFVHSACAKNKNRHPSIGELHFWSGQVGTRSFQQQQHSKLGNYIAT
jgi:hypothetical protein